MANSSILGGEVPAKRAKGKDVDALGPSDSSDSGSDVQGQSSMPTRADSPDQFGAVPVHRDSDSDAQGTGERASATGDEARDGADILPDRIKRDPTVYSDGALDDGLSADELADVDVEDLIADLEAEDEDEADRPSDGFGTHRR